jgi:small-conductance mechanosensitive channel
VKRILQLLGIILALGSAVLGPAQPARAETGAQQLGLDAETDASIRNLVQSMDKAERGVAQAKDREDELGQLRGEVEGILSESSRIAETLRPRLAGVKTQTEKLGPLPGKDAPPEAPAVAAERARLAVLASALDGAIRTTELTWVRARQLIERITELRHALFTRSLLQRLPSPLVPSLWRDLVNRTPAVADQLGYLAADWWSWAGPKSSGLGGLLIATVLLFVALRHTFRKLTASRQRQQRAVAPTFFERAAAVTWVAPVRAVAPIFSALLLYGGLDAMDLLYFPSDRVASALLKAIVVFAAIAAIISAVLAPREPDWRLVPLSDGSSRRISQLLTAITAVFAADIALAEISRWLFIPLTITVVQTIIANLLIALLLIVLLLTPFAKRDPNGPRISRHYPIWLKGPMWLVPLSIVAATMLGYIALGRFIAQQFVLTAVVVVVAGLLYLAVRAFTREPAEAGLPVGEILETRFGLDAPRRQTLARLTEFALTLTLVMLAVPIILLQWGFSGADIRDWFTSMFFGFEIGQFRISLARILLGIALFIALLLATRLVQRWLKEAMLQPSKMDPGIAHSIETVVGYAGTALAALLAISYAGFDITNLAIVAGALSVGIGFGLQSVVNNFVCGLILLVERPVKVGDWIVVGNEEGFVRRISVRSTEIETFDRSSVIIPNAELIAGRVKNWTLRDAVGRLKIAIIVRFSADPERAGAIMLKVASQHPDVLQLPAPFIGFDAFSADSATLSLNVFVGDVKRGGSVKTELSFAILKALQSTGIELAAAAPVPAGPRPTPSEAQSSR